ncbi:right-handed parallel beta-helix repeat-containing protein [Porphyrobacter sp. YT40]|uniref:beta strand repeat-containing protein n=1 Tax=Porphyrobacter sp. YT40 TaxID=2547601 RepID=UPI0011412756|nr:right-handed parallel beta-helix repeat-containing protein [Porphyrobacter sp. YT40]QDH35242.1 hypothetical protein E2E27_13485 [Porphyrobacter sp. YT40]
MIAGCLVCARRALVIAMLFLVTLTAFPDRAAAQTAITIDPATAVEAASTTVTLNHTVGSGSNRLILVSVAIERNDAAVSSVTYAGQPLSLLGRLTDPGAGATLEIWGRLAPTSGTNPVVVTLGNSAATVVGAISFANVSQTNAIAGGQLFGFNGGTVASGSVASTAEQLVIATIAANDEVNTVTAGAGQTSRWNVLNAADVIGAGSTRNGAAGSTTMSYTFPNPGRSVIGVIALQAASPLIVTNANDSGGGSLRAAIAAANASTAAETITFNIPGAGPHVITLASALPALTGNGDSIDGSTQPGAQCRDLWSGSAHDLRINLRGNGSFDGLQLSGSSQTVRGLALTGFDQAIRLLSTSNTATLYCNYLGLFPDGTTGANNRGVWVSGASARIGGLGAGQGNVISGNNVAGILTTQGSTDTAIRNNFIGTEHTGVGPRANGTGINHFNGIGTWRDITRNLISGNNGNAGITLESDDRISPSDGQIRIQGNIIGANRTLTALLRNGGDGILFDVGSITGVLIGGTASSEGNIITANGDGIELRTVTGIIIRGNTIAISGGRGIVLDGVTNATVGGTDAAQANSIGGNAGDALRIANNASGISVTGNLIRPVTTIGGTFANGGHGIALDNVSNITIGDGTTGGRNVIAGNGGRGIQGTGTNSAITINGNYIGTDLTGNVAVTNAQNMGALVKDAISFDQSGTINNLLITGNVIGGHAAAQVEVWNSTSNGVTITGNKIGIGADGVSAIVSGNTEELIFIGGGTSHSNVTIGGEAPGLGNLLANSAVSGIRLESTGINLQVIGNTIRNNARNGIIVLGNTRAALVSNRIYANGLLGIDLADNGVTANDAGDGDSGANDLLNFPQAIRANVAGPNQLRYNVTLDAPAAASGYRIEFFANSAADATGFGEGERFLGHVDITHAGGAQSYTGTLTTLQPVAIGDVISATTSRRTLVGTWDMTSEFSAVATAEGVAALTVAITSELFEPAPGNAFFIPGNDVLLTTTVSNAGTGSTDADSIFLAVRIDPAHAFHNAATPALGGVVGFQSGTPGLAFTPGTDLRFSDSALPPTSFGQCTYNPAPGYDPQVRHVCLNPKGTLPSGAPQGQFTVRLRARIG